MPFTEQYHKLKRNYEVPHHVKAVLRQSKAVLKKSLNLLIYRNYKIFTNYLIR